jgi:glycosyltransferase involved in cell wall biosynthesis
MRLQWKVLKPLLARAALLVAVSEFEAEHFASLLDLARDRFVVIPNGADLPPPKASHKVRDAGPLIASIGRLERYKGHHLVLDAFPRVLARFPRARLRIAGLGPEAQRLRVTAAKLGVANSVTIEPIPSSDREGMASLLSEASLVALLSEYEAQGIAAHEALSLGTPVLVGYTSALRDLADRSLAAAVPLDAAPDAIAAAIIRELQRPRDRPTVQLPTWDECATRLLATYRAILREPAAETAPDADPSRIARPVRDPPGEGGTF